MSWTLSWTGVLPYPGGGGIQLLALDPGDPSVIYAAAFSPVLLKSTDGGVSWSESQLPTDYIGFNSLALDPRSPDVVYAGVGNWTYGALLKSSDGGTTWVKLDFPTDNWVRDLV